VGLLGSLVGAPCELWFFFGALRRSLLYLRCNWIALNLCFFDINNITYQKKNLGIVETLLFFVLLSFFLFFFCLGCGGSV
jgi:hypothetical protein